jgi:hypothetical protein
VFTDAELRSASATRTIEVVADAKPKPQQTSEKIYLYICVSVIATELAKSLLAKRRRQAAISHRPVHRSALSPITWLRDTRSLLFADVTTHGLITMNKKVVREVNALPDSCRTPLLRKAQHAGCTTTRERGGSARELPGSKYDLCTSIWRGILLVKLSRCKLVACCITLTAEEVLATAVTASALTRAILWSISIIYHRHRVARLCADSSVQAAAGSLQGGLTASQLVSSATDACMAFNNHTCTC